jgi:fibronectin-binding autotransporter adhesin
MTGITAANVRNGGVVIDTNGNTITIGQALVHSTIGGDNAADGGLTKQGDGVLTMTGLNSYTGATTILTGTLVVKGSLAGTVGVAVNGGVLGGTGTIAGPTTSGSGATINPGTGLTTSGTLTINAGVTFNDGSTFAINVDTINNAVDQLHIGGTSSGLAFNGVDTLTFALVNGTQLSDLLPGLYPIATFTGARTGTLTTDLTLQPNWSIVYGAGVVDLQVTGIPEPGTWAMMAAGAGVLLGARRIRRRRW